MTNNLLEQIFGWIATVLGLSGSCIFAYIVGRDFFRKNSSTKTISTALLEQAGWYSWWFGHLSAIACYGFFVTGHQGYLVQNCITFYLCSTAIFKKQLQFSKGMSLTMIVAFFVSGMISLGIFGITGSSLKDAYLLELAGVLFDFAAISLFSSVIPSRWILSWWIWNLSNIVIVWHTLAFSHQYYYAVLNFGFFVLNTFTWFTVKYKKT